MTIEIPLDKNKDIEINIPEENLIGVIKPKEFPLTNEREEIKRAIKNPIDSKPLREIAKPEDKVVIVVTDITRKCRDDLICPVLLEELHLAGVKDKNIAFLLALGAHRPMTKEEAIEKLGRKIVDRFPVINHNCRNKDELVYLGDSKQGFPIYINEIVANADVKITTGLIEPHLFAGYSGGVKTVSVGVAGYDTLNATHSYTVLSNPKTKLGIIKGNIFREFLNEVADRVGVNFIVNLVLNKRGNLVRAFAGDRIKAFEEGVRFARQIYEVKINEQADIVISSPGYPKNLNLYQATRAANSVIFGPKPIVKKGGVIIIPAPCKDGVGDEDFYRVMSGAKSPDKVIEQAKRDGFKVGEHKAFVLSKILKHASIIMSDCKISQKILDNLHLLYAETLQQALNKNLKKRRNARVIVMPYGLITLPISK